MALFDRVIEVFIGNESIKNDITDLRVSFDILKTNTNIANRCTVSIYNLNPDNRGKIKELDDQIIVRAGYSEDIGTQLVFSGDILRINHQYPYPDVISKIEAGDGMKQVREKRSGISFKDKTDAMLVLKEIVKKLDIPISEIPQALKGEYSQGYAHTGSVKKALDNICKRFDLDWSVQNGKLQVIEKKGASKAEPVAIQEVTGLLEKVERVGDIQEYLVKNVARESPFLKFKTLLNPMIIPGGRVTLSQAGFPGFYKVMSVQHQGDNYEGDFITTCQVQQIGSGT